MGLTRSIAGPAWTLFPGVRLAQEEKSETERQKTLQRELEWKPADADTSASA